MSVSDLDLLRHEIAHAIGALCVGAEAVKIVIDGDVAEAIPAWPNNQRTDEQHLASLLAGRAYVVAGMDVSEDDAQIAEADPADVERIRARIMPVVEDRLECVLPAQLAAMLEVLRSDGGLLLTPEAIH